MEYALLPLKRYATFAGRSRRREYWFFALFCFVCEVVLSIVDGFLGYYDVATGVGLFSGLFLLVVLLPSIAVGVRRLHDIGKSGWWILIGFIPLLGTIVLLVFFCLDSQPGSNAYGPNPKESPESDAIPPPVPH